MGMLLLVIANLCIVNFNRFLNFIIQGIQTPEIVQILKSDKKQSEEPVQNSTTSLETIFILPDQTSGPINEKQGNQQGSSVSNLPPGSKSQQPEVTSISSPDKMKSGRSSKRASTSDEITSGYAFLDPFLRKSKTKNQDEVCDICLYKTAPIQILLILNMVCPHSRNRHPFCRKNVHEKSSNLKNLLQIFKQSEK